MNLDINQKNVHLLLPGKISWMTTMYMEDKKASLEDSLKALYESDLYSKLEQESTKYWQYGPVALYEIFSKEGSSN